MYIFCAILTANTQRERSISWLIMNYYNMSCVCSYSCCFIKNNKLPYSQMTLTNEKEQVDVSILQATLRGWWHLIFISWFILGYVSRTLILSIFTNSRNWQIHLLIAKLSQFLVYSLAICLFFSFPLISFYSEIETNEKNDVMRVV